jgi:Uncharacterized protein conserved in bacteria (DUF2252)
LSIKSDVREYEAWLRTQCKVVEPDLRHKHKRMKSSPFFFLRATYFRWARTIEVICPELLDAPAVLSIGDTHLENFGTWRDADGRLVWGVNDFDEGAVMPYALDLVRLAASIRLAPGVDVTPAKSAEAILSGYSHGLEKSRPCLIEQRHTRMLSLVGPTGARRHEFLKEMEKSPDAKPPPGVCEELMDCLPPRSKLIRFASRRRGGGSLGRQRFLAIACWCGGIAVREAKAAVPSAWEWAHKAPPEPLRFLDLAQGQFRAPDPFLRIRERFVVRRIAADARKIDLTKDLAVKLKAKVIYLMGYDLGAIHADDPKVASRIERDLKSRPSGWLEQAAKAAVRSVRDDFKAYKG